MRTATRIEKILRAGAAGLALVLSSARGSDAADTGGVGGSEASVTGGTGGAAGNGGDASLSDGPIAEADAQAQDDPCPTTV